MGSFEIERQDSTKTCVVRLSGDIDMAIVPELRAQVEEMIDTGCQNVVLSLGDVDYVDSSALGLLVGLDHKLRPFGGRLVLADSSRDVSRILELSGLVSVAASIVMSANVESALEGLQLPRVSAEPLWIKTFDMPIDVNQLSSVREKVCDVLRPLGFPESSLFDMKVALGEALANALRHGVIKPDEGKVEVRTAAYDDRIIMEVVDNGPGFDGCHTAEHDLYAPSGRGIMFMQALMDRVEFDCSDDGGTIVRLIKHRPGTA